MFGLFGDKSAREAKRLNTDAQVIVDHACQTFRPDRVREIARMTDEHLQRTQNMFEPDTIGLKRAIAEYERLHQEARRGRRDAELSAFTLVLIHLRADVQGEACQPARDIIAMFIVDPAYVPEINP